MISLIRTAARAASMNDASPPLHDDADGKGEEEEVVVDEKEDMAISAVEQRRILLPKNTAAPAGLWRASEGRTMH